MRKKFLGIIPYGEDSAAKKNVLLDTTTPSVSKPTKGMRGITVFDPYTSYSVSGRTQSGEMVQGDIELPFYTLTVGQRNEIFRQCSPVFSLVTGRMNRVSAFEWTITPEHKHLDEDEVILRNLCAYAKELRGQKGMAYQIAAMRIVGHIRRYLPQIFIDLSNFDAALLRRKRALQSQKKKDSEMVAEWLKQPNIHQTYEEFVKAYVYDTHIHGASATYKSKDFQNKLADFTLLPGGTVYPIRTKYVGGFEAYAQWIPGFETQIYYQNELSFDSYVPTSARAYGWVPLEALVNKVAEALMFDRLMADQADGTRPPDKAIIFGARDSMDPLATEDEQEPISEEEQKRLEAALNTARKNSIKIITGYGTPATLDLSRKDMLPTQMERQNQIDRHVAMVFNATNNEINQTGSEGTSGRATSEVNSEIDFGKGIMPSLMMLQRLFNEEIIPFRFGSGYRFEFKKMTDESQKIDLMAKKVQSGVFSVNEIRVKDLNEDPFKDPQFDLPAAAVVPPAGTQAGNPLYVTESK